MRVSLSMVRDFVRVFWQPKAPLVSALAALGLFGVIRQALLSSPALYVLSLALLWCISVVSWLWYQDRNRLLGPPILAESERGQVREALRAARDLLENSSFPNQIRKPSVISPRISAVERAIADVGHFEDIRGALRALSTNAQILHFQRNLDDFTADDDIDLMNDLKSDYERVKQACFFYLGWQWPPIASGIDDGKL